MGDTLYVDGGSRGNPGPAAVGVVLTQGGASVLEAGYLLSESTNNQAEYGALVLGLQAALRSGASDLTIYSDSELIVRQVQGKYRVASEDLKPLFQDAQRLLGRLSSWQIQHIPRNENIRADQLLNRALDLDEDVVEVDEHGISARLTPKADAVGSSDSLPPPAEGAKGPIVARCTSSSVEGRCPANCKEGDQFVFEAIVPPNMCVDAAYGVLRVIRELREAGQRAACEGAMKIMCPREGCQAFFEIQQLDQ